VFEEFRGESVNAQKEIREMRVNLEKVKKQNEELG
jgi:hypothetical protein